MDQYTRILNTANTVHTTTTAINKHIIEFAEKFATSIMSMDDSLNSISANINTGQTEKLAASKQLLQQIARELNHKFKKPLLQLQREHAKLTQILSQRILPFTLSQEIDVTEIKQLAATTQQLLIENSSKLENCALVLKMCQAKISNLDQIIIGLDLPNNVIKTAKQVNQVAQKLTNLNAKILDKDKYRNRYETEFKHLGEALEAFKIESFKFVDPELNTKTIVIKPPSP